MKWLFEGPAARTYMHLCPSLLFCCPGGSCDPVYALEHPGVLDADPLTVSLRL